MYHATKPDAWAYQAWIDWLHEELHDTLDLVESAEHTLSRLAAEHASDLAVRVTDPRAREDDFDREWARCLRGAEQFLDNARSKLTRLLLDHRGTFQRLCDATPNARPLGIGTDLTPEEMVSLGKGFVQLLDPLAVNSPYATEPTYQRGDPDEPTALYEHCQICGGMYTFGPSTSPECAVCAQAPQ